MKTNHTHMKITNLILVALWSIVLLGASALNAAENKVVWLDEMNLKNAVAGWGATQAKKTVDNRPLTLRGTVYSRGIGTHPPGSLSIDLGGCGVRFKATAGVDDEVGASGTVEFIVKGDGKKLWSSGVLKGKGEVKPCDIDLKGIKVLELLVDPTPDGYGNDHADWAEPVLTGKAATGPPAVAAHTVKAANLSVDLADNAGRSPLHLAAEVSREAEVVQALLAAGAAANARDRNGRTPLSLVSNDEQGIREVLATAGGV